MRHNKRQVYRGLKLFESGGWEGVDIAKRYFHRKAHILHIKDVHLKEKPCECKVCQNISQKAYLYRHTKTVHKFSSQSFPILPLSWNHNLI